MKEREKDATNVITAKMIHWIISSEVSCMSQT
jgi:hypothetical protein